MIFHSIQKMPIMRTNQQADCSIAWSSLSGFCCWVASTSFWRLHVGSKLPFQQRCFIDRQGDLSFKIKKDPTLQNRSTWKRSHSQVLDGQLVRQCLRLCPLCFAPSSSNLPLQIFHLLFHLLGHLQYRPRRIRGGRGAPQLIVNLQCRACACHLYTTHTLTNTRATEGDRRRSHYCSFLQTPSYPCIYEYMCKCPCIHKCINLLHGAARLDKESTYVILELGHVIVRFTELLLESTCKLHKVVTRSKNER